MRGELARRAQRARLLAGQRLRGAEIAEGAGLCAERVGVERARGARIALGEAGRRGIGRRRALCWESE